ncbi:MAG: aminotransferase class V-fold PLP-dependent enzyme, partial [Clostridia bacterium]|nr:aminotransferase class V-fold PLP-dependent enzyme [Clostridia bacterium]
MQKIYLDHSATTPLDREVLNKIVPYMTEDFGNPNSVHTFGRKAMQAVDFARDTVAQVLNAKPSEIYFTSGGTEGDNWAINSAVKAFNGKKNKILSLPIEHPAVLSTLSALSENGVIVEFIPVDSSGNIHLNYLEKAIDDSVGLVIAMTANNELGTLSPIKQIAKIAHSVGALFLTDAVQAVGVMKIDVKEIDADMVVISSHKFYGPKGVGALYCKNGVKLNGYIIGGHQEREKRGGTTNVAGVLGMALALKKASDGYLENAEKIKNLRDKFESKLIKKLTEY